MTMVGPPCATLFRSNDDRFDGGLGSVLLYSDNGANGDFFSGSKASDKGGIR